MTPHMVRYTVKADQATLNEELVRAIFAELDDAQPPGLRYAAFRLADGVTFIHLISHDPAEGHGPPPRLKALKAFHAGLRERCDEAPTRSEFTEIGSYPSSAMHSHTADSKSATRGPFPSGMSPSVKRMSQGWPE